jgi:hypothetical protein
MKRLVLVALSLIFSAQLASAAVVQPTTPLTGFTSTNTCGQSLTANVNCIGMVTNVGGGINPSANDSVAALNGNTFFGSKTWQTASGLSFTGANSLSGTFSFTGAAGYVYALVVKGGAGFNAFLLSGTSASKATWDTKGLLVGGKNRNQPALSHLTLYRSVTAVPVPASLPLLLGGLALLGFARRRRA